MHRTSGRLLGADAVFFRDTGQPEVLAPQALVAAKSTGSSRWLGQWFVPVDASDRQSG
jgi:hypothetical protein